MGDHRAACMRSGRVKRRAQPVEKAWARVFREARAKVQENVLQKDTNLAVDLDDHRQLEVVAAGLPLSRGVTLGVDATVVCPLRADGTAQPNAAKKNGETYHDLVNSGVRKLVVV